MMTELCVQIKAVQFVLERLKHRMSSFEHFERTWERIDSAMDIIGHW